MCESVEERIYRRTNANLSFKIISNLRIGSGSRDTGDIVYERKLENSLLRGMAHTMLSVSWSKDKHGKDELEFRELRNTRILCGCNMCRVSKLIRGMENYQSD